MVWSKNILRGHIGQPPLGMIKWSEHHSLRPRMWLIIWKLADQSHLPWRHERAEREARPLHLGMFLEQAKIFDNLGRVSHTIFDKASILAQWNFFKCEVFDHRPQSAPWRQLSKRLGPVLPHGNVHLQRQTLVLDKSDVRCARQVQNIFAYDGYSLVQIQSFDEWESNLGDGHFESVRNFRHLHGAHQYV